MTESLHNEKLSESEAKEDVSRFNIAARKHGLPEMNEYESVSDVKSAEQLLEETKDYQPAEHLKQGKLISWNDDRGFGFVQLENGKKSFIHIKSLKNQTPDNEIQVGMPVLYYGNSIDESSPKGIKLNHAIIGKTSKEYYLEEEQKNINQEMVKTLQDYYVQIYAIAEGAVKQARTINIERWRNSEEKKHLDEIKQERRNIVKAEWRECPQCGKEVGSGHTEGIGHSTDCSCGWSYYYSVSQGIISDSYPESPDERRPAGHSERWGDIITERGKPPIVHKDKRAVELDAEIKKIETEKSNRDWSIHLSITLKNDIFRCVDVEDLIRRIGQPLLDKISFLTKEYGIQIDIPPSPYLKN